jgi:hypothetical protein
MKIVARTIPGTAKMTLSPCASNPGPIHPSRPYTIKSARPTTTGEIATGRSMTALRKAFPGKRYRTRTSAHRTPNAVFTGTVMTTIRTVSQKACTASGCVMVLQTGARPCANMRHTIKVTGRAIRRAR